MCRIVIGEIFRTAKAKGSDLTIGQEWSHNGQKDQVISRSVSGSIVQMLPDVHAFMQHTDDENLTILNAVVGDVAVEMERSVPGAYLVAGLA